MKNNDDQIFLLSMKKYLRASIIFFVISAMGGCLYPKPVDDFSVLDDDVLSDLVRNSYDGEIGLSASGRLDKTKLKGLLDRLFMRQNRSQIETIFEKNQGECSSSAVPRRIKCSFFREWRLKNIGGPFDTSNWSDPAAKIEIIFIFDGDGRVQDLSLEVIDKTERKKING